MLLPKSELIIPHPKRGWGSGRTIERTSLSQPSLARQDGRLSLPESPQSAWPSRVKIGLRSDCNSVLGERFTWGLNPTNRRLS